MARSEKAVIGVLTLRGQVERIITNEGVSVARKVTRSEAFEMVSQRSGRDWEYVEGRPAIRPVRKRYTRHGVSASPGPALMHRYVAARAANADPLAIAAVEEAWKPKQKQ